MSGTCSNWELSVLVLGLGEGREAARDERTYVAVVIEGHAVELVRHEREGDVVGLIKVAQDLEEGASEPGMAGRVGGERRRESRPGKVAGRRAEGREGRIADGGGIAITGPRRASPCVGFADTGHR